MSGVKYDLGKPRPSLVLGAMAKALYEVAKVATFGAEKYSDNNWLLVENAKQRYTDAMYRHLLSGEGFDPESGLRHAAHAAWNALARLELELQEIPTEGVKGAQTRRVSEAAKSTPLTGLIQEKGRKEEAHLFGTPKALNEVLREDLIYIVQDANGVWWAADLPPEIHNTGYVSNRRGTLVNLNGIVRIDRLPVGMPLTVYTIERN